MTETCFSNWVQSHIFCFVWPKWWLSQTYNLLPYNVPKYSIKYHSLSLGKVNVENIMESARLWQCNIYTRGDTNVAALNKSSISLGKYFSGDLACSCGKAYRPETWHDCLHVYLWCVYQILFLLLIGSSFFMLQQWKPAIQCAQVLICENMIAFDLHLVTGSWS